MKHKLDYETLNNKWDISTLLVRDKEKRVVVYGHPYGSPISMEDIKDFDESLYRSMSQDIVKAKAEGSSDKVKYNRIKAFLCCEIGEDGDVTAQLKGSFESSPEDTILAKIFGKPIPHLDFPHPYPIELTDDLKFMVTCDFKNERYKYDHRLKFKACCKAYLEEKIPLYILSSEARNVIGRKFYTREEVDQVLKETNIGLTTDDIEREIATREQGMEVFGMQDKNEDDKESPDDHER